MSYSSAPRMLGAAFLLTMLIGECGMTLIAAEAVADGLMLVAYMSVAIPIGLAVFLFVLASRTSWDTLPDLKGQGGQFALFGLVLPWFVHRYAAAMKERDTFGARLVTALKYSLPTLGFALMGYLLMVANDRVGFLILFGLVVAAMSIGGAVSASFPVLFTVTFLIATVGMSFVLPNSENLLQAILLTFGRGWIAALVCVLFGTLIWKLLDRSLSRWLEWPLYAVITAVGAVVQAFVLWKTSVFFAGADALPFKRWVSEMTNSGLLSSVVFILWVLAPLFTLLTVSALED